MSEIDNREKINKNNNSVKWIKFPISEGMFPDILFEDKYLNKSEKYKMSEIDNCEIKK